jgi:hypothetical protein
MFVTLLYPLIECNVPLNIIYIHFISVSNASLESKSKAVPLPPCRCRGVRKYYSYLFLTSALDGGEWSASRPSLAFPPGKRHPVPIGYEAGWATELVRTHKLEKKSFASAGDQTPVVESVVRHCTDWASPAPKRFTKQQHMGILTTFIFL